MDGIPACASSTLPNAASSVSRNGRRKQRARALRRRATSPGHPHGRIAGSTSRTASGAPASPTVMHVGSLDRRTPQVATRSNAAHGSHGTSTPISPRVRIEGKTSARRSIVIPGCETLAKTTRSKRPAERRSNHRRRCKGPRTTGWPRERRAATRSSRAAATSGPSRTSSLIVIAPTSPRCVRGNDARRDVQRV